MSDGQVYFTHIRGYGSGRHLCLKNGYWCWSNLREHPLDVIKYLKKLWANKGGTD